MLSKHYKLSYTNEEFSITLKWCCNFPLIKPQKHSSFGALKNMNSPQYLIMTAIFDGPTRSAHPALVDLRFHPNFLVNRCPPSYLHVRNGV
jgi:hypothetical protein